MRWIGALLGATLVVALMAPPAAIRRGHFEVSGSY